MDEEKAGRSHSEHSVARAFKLIAAYENNVEFNEKEKRREEKEEDEKKR